MTSFKLSCGGWFIIPYPFFVSWIFIIKFISVKNKIRQILREETSEFDPKMLNTLYQFMNNLTKGYVWYHDTPEQRFRLSWGSIWLINPETKEWAIELRESGEIWLHAFYINFKRYFNMNRHDYKWFIKLWVKDVLNRKVSELYDGSPAGQVPRVEDVLNRGKQMK